MAHLHQHFLISHPFRLGVSGEVAKVAQDSDAHKAEAVFLFLQTMRGERILVPQFGTPDPAFSVEGAEEALLIGQIEMFGPPLQVISFERVSDDGSTQSVLVEFD